VKIKTKDGSEKKRAGPEGAEGAGAGRAGAQKEDIAGGGRCEGENGAGAQGKVICSDIQTCI